MASLRDIRKRIRSVKNTQKITKAMKMVAAAKLRRSQERVEAARPFADKLHETVSALSKRAQDLGEAPHPLLVAREQPKRIELIVMTSDRGLCGGFNSNTIRRALRFLFDHQAQYEEIRVSTIGKKGFEAMKRERANLHKNHAGALEQLSFVGAKAIAEDACAAYAEGAVDGVYLLYNEFVNAATQRLTLKQLLPVVPLEVEEGLVDYEYEPSREELLDALLPRHFATQLYRAMLESVASEHGARMSAMDSASKNAKDVVDRLTLEYNRARQAAITKELMEIISGAEALK